MTLSASSLLCLALFHFLWQGAAIAVVTLLMAALLRRLSPHAQYLALLSGLIALPLAFVVTVGWLGMQSQVDANSLVVLTDLPAQLDGESRPLFLLADGPAKHVEQIPAATWQRYSPLLAGVYLLAVVVLSGRLLLGLCGARRLVRESASVNDERLLRFVDDQCLLLGLRTAPLVAYCRDVAVPTVIGVLRPSILLPLAATTGMTTEEIETILTHELVHIRRRDQLFVLLQRLLEIVFFFHPAVWLLSRRISDVREHCCDDRVISLGIEPQLYIESLLRAAELSLFGPTVKPSSSLAIALSAVDQPSRLRERIMRLMDRPAPAPLKLRPGAVVLLVALLAVVIGAPLVMQSFAQAPAIADLEKNDAEKNQEKSPAALHEEATQRELMELESQAALLHEYENENRSDLSVANTYLDIDRADDKDTETLIRRLYRELKGDSPTPEDIAAFRKILQEDQLLTQRLTREKAADRIVYRTLVDWIEPAAQFRGKLGSQFEMQVTGNTEGYVWGSDVYTDDSDLGAAAVHAGLLKPGETGTVMLTVVKSPARHVGSRRHGVTSHDFGSFGGSFMLHKPSQPGAAAATAVERLKEMEIQVERARAQAQLAHAQELQAQEAVMRAREFLARATAEQRNRSKAEAPQYVEVVGMRRTKTASDVADATPFSGKLGRQFDVEVVGSTQGMIWGTDVYTDDSHIATAAVHAGAVKPNERAIVTVTMVESPEQHEASSRNGVQSAHWGGYSSSYIVMRKTGAAVRSRPGTLDNAIPFRGKFGRRFDLEIVGQTAGSVWGTDVYTDDSNIATAAVHAGIVKPGERAIVTLTIVESPEHHRASKRNGVTSLHFGSFPSSFILQRARDDTAMLGGQKTFTDGGTMRVDGAHSLSLRGFAYGGSDSLSDRPLTAAPPAAPVAPPQRATRFLLDNGRGGSLTIEPLPGSITLPAEVGTQVTVELTGRTTGPVGGTGIYTDDSDIATAAVHAGLLKPGEHGTITVTRVKSPGEFTGSNRNGVSSTNWADHPSGVILLRLNPDPAEDAGTRR